MLNKSQRRGHLWARRTTFHQTRSKMAEQADQVESLLFETSPFGNVDAIVEHDGRCVYFYLNGKPPFGTRACWVRNLVKGPLALDQSDMIRGIPPVLPRIYCRTQVAGSVPGENDLRIIWFVEGNGAALLERDELLAVIPPWSGQDGFHGYSRDCTSENEICWPLPANPNLERRIAKADSFWRSWQSSSPFAELQPRQLRIYESQFGRREKYFAIDSQRFPPRGMGQFNDGKQTTLATIGMSLFPQPNVEMFVEDALAARRIELGIRLPHDADDSRIDSVGGQLGGLAARPWVAWTWFGHGHTCEFDFDSSRRQAIFLAESKTQFAHNGISDPLNMPKIDGDPVEFLWIVPLTQGQFTRIQSEGLTQQSLQEFGKGSRNTARSSS